MECVEVCADNALEAHAQDDDSIAELKDNWDFWLDLPNTPKHYQQIDDLEEAVGALHTLLLDKEAFPTTYNEVGDIINYDYVVTNSGNIPAVCSNSTRRST